MDKQQITTRAEAMAATIRDRRERGVVPFIPWGFDEVANILQAMAGMIGELQAERDEERASYRRLTEAAETVIDDMQEAAKAAIELWANEPAFEMPALPHVKPYRQRFVEAMEKVGLMQSLTEEEIEDLREAI